MRTKVLHGRCHWSLAVLLLAAGSVRAQEPESNTDLTVIPLEQLMSLEVFSASRFNQKATQAPSNVTVLTAADIRAHGWRSLAEALRSIRGLYTSNDRSYSYLGARGFMRPGDFNTRFLLQIDGTRINDPVFDQAQVGNEFPIDLELVDRIEFVPGPGSSVYGANAFFGVINVITKRAADMEGLRGVAQVGQAGLRSGSASYAWRKEDAEFVLSATRMLSKGRDLHFPEFGGTSHGLDWERASRLYARGQHGPLSVTLLSGARRKGIATASFGQPFDVPGGETLDQLRLAELAYRSALSPLHGELTARLYHGSYRYDGHYVIDEPNHGLNIDLTHASWWGADASLFIQPVPGHKIVLGADFQYNGKLVQENFDISPFLLYLAERRSGKRFGLYAQDEIAVGERLLLNAGLRYDRESSTGSVVNPRLALIATLTPETTAKAIYGSAFRAPNNYELYYAFPGDGGQLANPALGRERIRSLELSLVRQLGSNARFTLAGYVNKVSSLITQVEDEDSGLPIFRNVGQADARGVEAEYEARFGRGGSLRASIGRQRVAAGVSDVNSPRTLAKLNVASRLGGPWFAALEGQYVSARQQIGGGFSGSYSLLNLSFYSIGLTRHVDIALALRNLLDRRYADPAPTSFAQRELEQDGRRLDFKIRFAY